MNNEQMAKQVLNEMLERAVNAVDTATQFSREHIPDVVDQLLMWHGIESFMFFVFGVAIFGVVVFVTKTMLSMSRLTVSKEEARAAYDRGEQWTRYKTGATSDEYDEIMRGDNLVPVIAIVIIASIPAFTGIAIAVNNLEWLQIIVAPKLYLLEYAAELVK